MLALNAAVGKCPSISNTIDEANQLIVCLAQRGHQKLMFARLGNGYFFDVIAQGSDLAGESSAVGDELVICAEVRRTWAVLRTCRILPGAA